jgi:HEPN domain-containing protein
VGNPTEGGGPLNREEIIQYWITGADSDYQTMVHLYESKDYHWSLFMGHLVLEKIFKAIYVQNVDRDVSRTHDLLRLSQRSKLDLTDEQKDLLDLITDVRRKAPRFIYGDIRRTLVRIIQVLMI